MEVGEHGFAELDAIIADEKEDELIRKGFNQKFASFSTKGGGNEEIIFAGVITKVEVFSIKKMTGRF